MAELLFPLPLAVQERLVNPVEQIAKTLPDVDRWLTDHGAEGAR